MEYDGKEEKFRAKTRNGATLEYDKHELVRAVREREEEETDENLLNRVVDPNTSLGRLVNPEDVVLTKATPSFQIDARDS